MDKVTKEKLINAILNNDKVGNIDRSTAKYLADALFKAEVGVNKYGASYAGKEGMRPITVSIPGEKDNE